MEAYEPNRAAAPQRVLPRARQDQVTSEGADPIAAEIAALSQLGLDDLRVRWRKLFRKSAPAHLPRSLLLRMIAYRIQADVFGDLDRETVRFLDRIAKQRRPGAKCLVPPVSEARPLKIGAEFVREHDGVLHRVRVVEGGYSWSGTTYRSLSEVARAITGTRWNGPRFFGLRDRPARGDEA